MTKELVFRLLHNILLEHEIMVDKDITGIFIRDCDIRKVIGVDLIDDVLWLYTD